MVVVLIATLIRGMPIPSRTMQLPGPRSADR